MTDDKFLRRLTMSSKSDRTAWLLILVYLFLTQHTLAFNVMCDREHFGTPSRDDCLPLYSRLADWADKQSRLFGEPDILPGQDYSWPAIINPFQVDVVQVPKYWTYREE